jgi:hypothetical protein
MFHGEQCGSCVGVCLWFVVSRQHLSVPSAICSHLKLVNNVWYTSEQRVLLYDTYVQYDLLESVGKNFNMNFVMKAFPADKQFTSWWINLKQQDS